MRVLLVTYYVPPRPAVASVRLGGLAKYLPRFGWEPVILTALLPTGAKPNVELIETTYTDVVGDWKKRLGFHADANLRAELRVPTGPGVRRGIRDRALGVARELISFPDDQRGWYRPAVAAGLARLRNSARPIDAIVSSSSPVTAHFIAARLQRASGLPWIADLRDLWTQQVRYPYSRVRKTVEKQLEMHTLRRACAVVTVSEPLSVAQRRLLPAVPVHTVLNGFDPDDQAPRTQALTKKLTITYTGSLYGGMCDPTPLVRVLKQLIDAGSIDRGDVEVRFFGPREQWFAELITSLGLDDVVRQHGVVPRSEAVARQRESQVLLVLLWNDPDPGTYTGKVFEYLAAARPMLALALRDSVVERLVSDTNAGVLVPRNDEAALSAALLRFYRELKATGRVAFTGIESQIKRFSHVDMAERYAQLLNEARTSRAAARGA